MYPLVPGAELLGSLHGAWQGCRVYIQDGHQGQSRPGTVTLLNSQYNKEVSADIRTAIYQLQIYILTTISLTLLLRPAVSGNFPLIVNQLDILEIQPIIEHIVEKRTASFLESVKE